jgi:hypothetical protein
MKGLAGAILVAFAVLFATGLFQVVKGLGKAASHPDGLLKPTVPPKPPG